MQCMQVTGKGLVEKQTRTEYKNSVMPPLYAFYCYNDKYSMMYMIHLNLSINAYVTSALYLDCTLSFFFQQLAARNLLNLALKFLFCYQTDILLHFKMSVFSNHCAHFYGPISTYRSLSNLILSRAGCCRLHGLWQ